MFSYSLSRAKIECSSDIISHTHTVSLSLSSPTNPTPPPPPPRSPAVHRRYPRRRLPTETARPYDLPSVIEGFGFGTNEGFAIGLRGLSSESVVRTRKGQSFEEVL
ncbi:hypothetical protein LOK49_LG15G01464 [Camellia lanceoleosa]|uniref:Uncharacterized protein n=1 Tax=Camellia lanceoleosa TaxID=1840588 RepID=A0ACC0F4D2_9ERIC|nr:hypothetical protein LOK49_LG15G01464 [Camellia lanceoleosa]